jgi:heme oxygenase
VEQDFAEVSVAMSAAKKALDAAYKDLGVEMQQGGTASRGRIHAVKDAMAALDEALPKETRKLLAEGI